MGSRCGVGVNHEAQWGVRPSGVGADVRERAGLVALEEGLDLASVLWSGGEGGLSKFWRWWGAMWARRRCIRCCGYVLVCVSVESHLVEWR